MLEDAKINIKIKLSALWISVLILYAYGDIFGLFRPGFIEEIQAGRVFVFQINQVFLLGISVYIIIPSVMVFASLVLKPAVNRWANIVLGVFYTATVLLSTVGETWVYYILLSLAESALLLLIVWYAWRWPRQDGSEDAAKSA